MKIMQTLTGVWKEIKNFTLHKSNGTPANIVEGGFYYDTADKTPKYFDGSISKPFGQNDHSQLDNLDVGDPHPQYVLGTEIGVTIPPLSAGKIPTSYLPSYVDDVLEYANLAAFPVTGEASKIYVAIDTNKIYRWTGSAYGEISSSIALGETSATAYRGDRGAIAYTHSQTTGNPHGATKSDLGLGNVDNTSDVNKPVSSAMQTALNGKQTLDATLTALSALDTTKGLLVQTGTDTFAKRTLVNGLGTVVGNGSGETANPYVNVDFEATASNIKSNGTQTVGTRNTAARGDHVHPSDTSKVSNAPEYTLTGLGVSDNLWGKIAEISGMNATYNRGSFIIVCNIMNGSYFDMKLSVECSSGDASPNINMRQYAQTTTQMFTAVRNGLVWEIWMRAVNRYDKALITVVQKDPSAATYTFFNASANTTSVTGTAPTIVLGLSSTQYTGLTGGSSTTLHTHANATNSVYGLVQIEDAVTNGSTKAITSNAVFDALATKASKSYYNDDGTGKLVIQSGPNKNIEMYNGTSLAMYTGLEVNPLMYVNTAPSYQNDAAVANTAWVNTRIGNPSQRFNHYNGNSVGQGYFLKIAEWTPVAGGTYILGITLTHSGGNFPWEACSYSLVVEYRDSSWRINSRALSGSHLAGGAGICYGVTGGVAQIWLYNYGSYMRFMGVVDQDSHGLFNASMWKDGGAIPTGMTMHNVDFGDAKNADTTDGYHIVCQSSVPSSPASNTIYFCY